jgi:hypothetical protein
MWNNCPAAEQLDKQMLAFACPTKGRTVVPHASCFFFVEKKREEDKGEQPSCCVVFVLF